MNSYLEYIHFLDYIVNLDYFEYLFNESKIVICFRLLSVASSLIYYVSLTSPAIA
jgi:hypothetical protein